MTATRAKGGCKLFAARGGMTFGTVLKGKVAASEEESKGHEFHKLGKGVWRLLCGTHFAAAGADVQAHVPEEG